MNMLTTTATLDIILPISNPRQFETRSRLFHQTYEKIKASKGNFRLWVVEGAFGNRPFDTEGMENAIQVRLDDELWHKENLINIAIAHLPEDYQYVAWIDADISFLNDDWITQTVDALQHHPVVQPWSDCIHFGPKNEILHTHKSFGWCNQTGQAEWKQGAKNYGPFWHPGFAWAARREVIEATNGLIDQAVLGSADHHMAKGWCNSAQETYPEGINENYKQMVLDWQEKAYKVVRGDIGYVAGTIEHFWHGRLVDRKYQERWDILKQHDFNPIKHLVKDLKGVLHFTEEVAFELRRDIRNYFVARQEDANIR